MYGVSENGVPRKICRGIPGDVKTSRPQRSKKDLDGAPRVAEDNLNLRTGTAPKAKGEA